MIGFLLRHLSDVPDGDVWLTAAEREWFTDRRSAKRVAEWRLGRWTAKAAVRAFLELRAGAPPGELEVLAAEDGAPEIFADRRPLGLALSLSHSHGRALAVVGEGGTEPGCDLEAVAERSPRFVADYLTAAERNAVAAVDNANRDLLVNLIWSAKESALKALRRGLSADTRSVEVVVRARPGPGWGRLEVACPGHGLTLAGRWRRFDDLVATIVCQPAPDEVIDLDRR